MKPHVALLGTAGTAVSILLTGCGPGADSAPTATVGSSQTSSNIVLTAAAARDGLSPLPTDSGNGRSRNVVPTNGTSDSIGGIGAVPTRDAAGGKTRMTDDAGHAGDAGGPANPSPGSAGDGNQVGLDSVSQTQASLANDYREVAPVVHYAPGDTSNE